MTVLVNEVSAGLDDLGPDPSWCPQHYTPRTTSRTRGDDIIDFAETFMTVSAGMRKGEPLVFTDWQKWLIRSIFEEDEFGYLKKRRAIVGLPRKNGKSLIGAAVILGEMFYATGGEQFYSAGGSDKTARIVYNEVFHQINRSPELRKMFSINQKEIKRKEKNLSDVVYRVISTQAMNAQGFNPYLVVGDEIHAWGNQADELWSAINDGSGNLPESLVLGISTADDDKDSLLGRLYTRGLKEIEKDPDDRDDTYGIYWWEAPDHLDPESEEAWLAANPNLAEGLIDVSEMLSNFRDKEGKGRLNEFYRYKLNRWVNVSNYEQYISDYLLNTILNPDADIPKGADICVGFDGSRVDDSTVFVGVDVNTGVLKVLAAWEKPSGPDADWQVDPKEVNEAKARIFSEYNVLKLFADTRLYGTEIDKWDIESPGVIFESPQSLTRILTQAERLKEFILNGVVSINPADSVLVQHFRNAVVDKRGKVKKDREKSIHKVDAVIASMLAVHGYHIHKVEKEKRESAKAVTTPFWLD